MALLEALSPEDMREVAACLSSAGHVANDVLNKLFQLRRFPSVQAGAQVGMALSDYGQVRPFAFQGNEQDLSIFWNRDSLSKVEIARLEEPLNGVVLNSFNHMAESGLVELQNGSFSPTATGRSRMYSEDFITAVVRREKEQISAAEKIVGKAARRAQKQAAETVAGKAVVGAAGAVSTAGISLTAQVLQEAVTHGTKAISLTTKTI